MSLYTRSRNTFANASPTWDETLERASGSDPASRADRQLAVVVVSGIVLFAALMALVVVALS